MIGLLHPGAMGAALGAALVGAGHEVAWCSAGRSADSARRADDAGLADVVTVRRLLASCVTVVSVCPPQGAATVAAQACGYEGLFVDANAISPRTAERIGASIIAGGGCFVDASIIGMPPTAAGQTRLYLSGARADEVAENFRGTWFEARVIGDDSSRASALKMAYAGWTKGGSALLMAVSALATELGVLDELHAEWDDSLPGLRARSTQGATAAGHKAWRWVFEMAEFGESLDDAGLPGDFGRAAAAMFDRIAAAD